MTPFDQLHPAIQHHIVNSLGWRTLRPLQEESIEPLLSGEHAILLAPTAGGKTEAAVFPVLSRMLAENWTGLSVIYLCPIRALLNNLHNRLSHFCGLVGRSCAVWHGDIAEAEKRQFSREVTDCLLTTPESLEVMLVSQRLDKHTLLKDLRVVIVDEIHSFAGDDRGWHVLSLLERLTKIAGRELQRLGLSATVGNAEELLGWLAGHCDGTRAVIKPLDTAPNNPDVQIDFVGNVENAALVISRLHRGEKRLVFTDSRSQAEQLAARLQRLGISTFVSHSSLSSEERRKGEDAFSVGSDCVIVATSTLELGVDVGDLDRVIQLDAPATVSSFLQRMGRSGRRSGSSRNCLFLATSRSALLRAAGLIELWASGYVEPVKPPPLPFHILAQQLMALALQEGGIGRSTWWDWICRMPAFSQIEQSDRAAIVAHMFEAGLLADDEGVLWFGRAGEEAFGRKNFMEIFSVFQAPPLFSVRHGIAEIGQVHETSFLVRGNSRPVLVLGGRGWKTTTIDWGKRIAYVEPSDELGRSRWFGFGQPMSFALCQAIKQTLQSGPNTEHFSRRGAEELQEAQSEFRWLDPECTSLIRGDDQIQWWTFAGLRANATLTDSLRNIPAAGFDNLCIRFDRGIPLEALEKSITNLREHPPKFAPVADLERAIDQLKFSTCLPRQLAERMLAVRLADPDAVAGILAQPLRVVAGSAMPTRNTYDR
jgi:ATP-dependent helicase Lhr and Lhr-like helicase